MARRAQAPGGNSSFVFDDGWSGALREPARRPLNLDRGVDVHVMREHEGEAAHRHTNGLRRSSTGDYTQPPGGYSSNIFGTYQDNPPPSKYEAASYKQPPGGHSSNIFGAPPQYAPPPGGRGAADAASAAPQGRKQPPGGHSSLNLGQDDSLSEFVASQPRSVPTSRGDPQVPPGGHSSFSIGWGGDNERNHHHDFQSRRQPLFNAPRSTMAPQEPRGGFGRASGAAVDSWGPPSSTAAGGAMASRASTRVCAPPGGVSSFVFG